ncbi:hypothetical protein TNCV_2984701 [Trichonephila clavipes]|nr:hypothetical protein TNCV_2984701 [Trichonephila clavipes]
MEVPLRTAYGQNGRCSMQPKPSSLRAQAQLKHELKLELVEEKQKLLDIREKGERARVPNLPSGVGRLGKNSRLQFSVPKMDSADHEGTLSIRPRGKKSFLPILGKPVSRSPHCIQ